MITFLVIVLLIGITLKVKYNPSLSYVSSVNRLILWYDIPKKAGHYNRSFIILYEK